MPGGRAVGGADEEIRVERGDAAGQADTQRLRAERLGARLVWTGRLRFSYSKNIPLWVAKCRASVESGQADLVIALVSARVDTPCWHANVAGCADIYMLKDF